MKKKDFIQLIDLKAEYKEYTHFDSSKSEKYKTYREWDTHIKSILNTVKGPTELYDLKRYCIDVVRFNKDVVQLFWGYLGLAFPLILAFSTESDRIGLKGFVFSLILMAFLVYIAYSATVISRKRRFYQDILNIIEQIENKDKVGSCNYPFNGVC